MKNMKKNKKEFMDLTKRTRNDYCNFCGAKYTDRSTVHLVCTECKNITYRNPMPVVVALVPVFHRDTSKSYGWLVEQRNIDPEKGGWALPGGYIELGETWQEAAARELNEELGLVTKPKDYSLFEVVNSANKNLLIFGVHTGVFWDDIKFEPNEEVSAIQAPVSPQDLELCFPTHNEMWLKYYNETY